MDENNESVTEKLKAFAEKQKNDIEAELVEAALVERFEVEVEGETRLDRLRSFFEEQARIAGEKLGVFEAVEAEVRTELEERWDGEFLLLMDGKRSLGEFSATTPFRSTASLVNAIIVTLRDCPDLVPPGIASLRSRLTELAVETRVDRLDSDQAENIGVSDSLRSDR